MDKRASSEVAWALLTEGVSGTRIELHRLKHALNRALSLVESSEKREHLYEVAGDLIESAPKQIAKMERLLDRTSFALSNMGETFLKARLPIEDRTRVQEAIQVGNPVARRSVASVVERYLDEKG